MSSELIGPIATVIGFAAGAWWMSGLGDKRRRCSSMDEKAYRQRCVAKADPRCVGTNCTHHCRRNCGDSCGLGGAT